ncbi:MAG TPA: thiamine pyrophosphate-dependent enzyme [Chitinophagaceae bacterium]|nr:thiamine pyrophosphate-dependent enzyme [Chitinophagaceae bacterium]
MDVELLLKAYRLMRTARSMAGLYEANRQVCRYVHSTSSGHEAIQIASGLQLKPFDYACPYYRDDSMLLALGYRPYELMLQLLARAEDPFSGGMSYYCHPSNREPDKPTIIHQSSATGMQAIPATGIAQGIRYLEMMHLDDPENRPVVLCSMGDGSVTEGEVSEAWQFAVLHGLPIIYLIQDNDWGISAPGKQSRAMNAYEYAGGFRGMERVQLDGTDFPECYKSMETVIRYCRISRKPILVHARVCLLGHHTSGVRKEWYRSPEDLELHRRQDPIPRFREYLLREELPEESLREIETESEVLVAGDFQEAAQAQEPDPFSLMDHVFEPTPVTRETGVVAPPGATKVMMVDAALHAIEEILEQYPEAIFFGQDVGRPLGGVFREAALLAEKFGDHRVFNTAIQEAYIIGSCSGLAATGVKPIVEVQFGDYLFPGINQLVTELSKSCFLTRGKFPVGAVIRVPVGAYGGGGPYHSASVESILLSIKGIKVAFPSNAADLKGLMKAAFLDPNPVVLLEHKGLYWSKVPGTQDAQTPEPAADYMLPLGKGKIVLAADPKSIQNGETVCVITYGMGVYWALHAAESLEGKVEIVDLRTLYPLDEQLVFDTVKRHGKCLVLTEEQLTNSFCQALAGRIGSTCFQWLDAPIQTIGALDLPSVPLNSGLEQFMLPNAEKVRTALESLLTY